MRRISDLLPSGFAVWAEEAHLRREPSTISIGGQMTCYETGLQNSVRVEPSSFDGESRFSLVSYLAGFISDCDVRRSKHSSEGLKGCQRAASAAACGAIKFRRPMQFGCMNG